MEILIISAAFSSLIFLISSVMLNFAVIFTAASEDDTSINESTLTEETPVRENPGSSQVLADPLMNPAGDLVPETITFEENLDNPDNLEENKTPIKDPTEVVLSSSQKKKRKKKAAHEKKEEEKKRQALHEVAIRTPLKEEDEAVDKDSTQKEIPATIKYHNIFKSHLQTPPKTRTTRTSKIALKK